MRSLIFFSLSVLLALYSCKKDEEIVCDPIVNTAPVYQSFSEGSYWTYQNVRVESDGTETIESAVDSIVVAGDTLINGLEYTVFEGTSWPFQDNEWGIIWILREENGELLDEQGNIIMSCCNFTDTLNTVEYPSGEEIFATATYMMSNEIPEITVPGGTFAGIELVGTFTILNEPEGPDNPRYTSRYYAQGIGQIRDTWFFAGNTEVHYEKRLLDYHIGY
ncbi:hypothetical protein [Sanyastnella coralliicola]|uniref:hypothetical protein n=1 Tax=Sanyastnella coralliicola TaxID=3069118 RepID=UPI0027BA8F1A|nr:hypothetical protein [Longitalea sp. SCSIO 12813]